MSVQTVRINTSGSAQAGAVSRIRLVSQSVTGPAGPSGSAGGALIAANNLSDLASAATARTNLGLAIGTDVQAYSSVLAATTASFLTADETKLDGIEAGADVTDLTVAVNAQTASYVLVLSDAFRAVEVTLGTPTDVTVPPNSSVAFPVGTVIEVAQMGAGQVSIVAGSGVTVNSRGGLLGLAGQYAVVSLRKRDTDSWLLAGDVV